VTRYSRLCCLYEICHVSLSTSCERVHFFLVLLMNYKVPWCSVRTVSCSDAVRFQISRHVKGKSEAFARIMQLTVLTECYRTLWFIWSTRSRMRRTWRRPNLLVVCPVHELVKIDSTNVLTRVKVGQTYGKATSIAERYYITLDKIRFTTVTRKWLWTRYYNFISRLSHTVI